MALNNTYTAPIKMLFTMMQIVSVVKWVVIIFSIIGLGVSGYLFFKQNGQADITPAETSREKPTGISRIHVNALAGHDNPAMIRDNGTKY